jgi:hypothetical protein
MEPAKTEATATSTTGTYRCHPMKKKWASFALDAHQNQASENITPPGGRKSLSRAGDAKQRGS